MALLLSLRLLAVSAGIVSACPQLLRKRQEAALVSEDRYWMYEQSYDWGRQNPAWELCQTGTQQSPIPLRLDQGLSRNHVIHFDYPNTTSGTLQNSGYGPAYAVDVVNDDYTQLPSMTFAENGVNETVYLINWHLHAPADHSVQGDRSKAELHLVHADASGHERSVLALRIDPSRNSRSAFFDQIPDYIGYNETSVTLEDAEMNLNLALEEVNEFSDFWTYKGSLTSPPCTEGLRWFVARDTMFVHDTQMQDILRASTFSARAEQEVWNHEINV